MDAGIKARWLEALRSDTYPQTRGQLKGSRTDGYCCLGVLVDVVAPELWTDDGDGRKGLVTLEEYQDDKGKTLKREKVNAYGIPPALYDRFTITHEQHMVACNMNDIRQWSFKEIADEVEKTF